jgi:hypothetical protein
VAGGGEADGDDGFELLGRILLKGQGIDQDGAAFVRNGMHVALEINAIVPDVQRQTPGTTTSTVSARGFGSLIGASASRSNRVNDT